MFNREMWQVNNERHGALLKVAESHRFTKMERVLRPSHKQHFCVCLGERLISVGLRLQGAYGPAGRSGPSHRSGHPGPIV